MHTDNPRHQHPVDEADNVFIEDDTPLFKTKRVTAIFTQWKIACSAYLNLSPKRKMGEGPNKLICKHGFLAWTTRRVFLHFAETKTLYFHIGLSGRHLRGKSRMSLLSQNHAHASVMFW